MPQRYPFQDVGVDFLAARKVALLADDMGLGKTVQAIGAADRVDAKSICVVCPAIAKGVWPPEFKVWSKVDRTIQVIRSAADAGHLTAGVVIVSYALVQSCLSALRARSFDVLICDEAQALKRKL